MLLQSSQTYLDYYNKTEASFNGLVRTDLRDYPEEAIREALLNSIIHRDYLFSGSTIINVYDDRMEFISLGVLVSGISMEAVFLGASQSRNPNLAAVFYRLGLVESYGTGVRKILRLYKGFVPQPAFRSAEGAFTVEMWNRNVSHESESGADKEGRSGEMSELEADILSFVKEKGSTARKEIEERFHIGSTKAYKLLKLLCAEGFLVQKLNGNKTIYLAL